MCYHGKTMLTCYTLLDSFVEQIENLIKKKAKNSFYNYSSTLVEAENLIRLAGVREDLLELKEITKETLENMPESDRVLICYKYFGIMPSDDVDISSRNYFRKQNKAINLFNSKLMAKGFTEDWFKDKYLKIAFISGVYKKMISEEGKKHSKI